MCRGDNCDLIPNVFFLYDQLPSPDSSTTINESVNLFTTIILLVSTALFAHANYINHVSSNSCPSPHSGHTHMQCDAHWFHIHRSSNVNLNCRFKMYKYTVHVHLASILNKRSLNFFYWLSTFRSQMWQELLLAIYYNRNYSAIIIELSTNLYNLFNGYM